MSELIKVRLYHNVKLKRGQLLAAWPGMGNVAIGGISYLRRKLNSQVFGEIDTSAYFEPNKIIIENGICILPQVPKNYLYVCRDPDLIFFEGPVQLSGRGGVDLLENLLTIVRECGVVRLFTGAAFPMPISYQDECVVYGVANKPSLRNYLIQHNIKIMEEGQISGLNGLLLGYAEEYGIEGMCLLVTLPQYAIEMFYPKAAKKLVDVLQYLLGIHVDLTELDFTINEVEQKLKIIEEKMSNIFSGIYSPNFEKEINLLQRESVPVKILAKIENLFVQAKADRNKAVELKRELDRWNLYKLYEDRFLDLFKTDIS